MKNLMTVALFLLLGLSTHVAHAQSPVSVAPDSWSTGNPMPTPRASPFVAVVGNLIYVIGGRGLNYANLSVNEIYDPSTNTWSTGAPMPTPRVNGASVVANNIIYAIGGIGHPGVAGTYSVVEAYDPATNTWSTKASMPIPVYDAYAAVYNGYIYVIGGANSGGRLNTLMAYQIATNAWTTLAPLIVQKSGYGLGLFGSRIIAAGGAIGNTIVSDNEAYDIPSNSWRAVTPLPTPRFNGCSGVVGNMLYFGGGQTTGGVAVNTLDAYDPASNSWTTGLATMPYGVVQIGSAVFSGNLYCFGGEDISNNTFNYLQIYHPSAAPSISAVISASAFGAFPSISPGSWVEIYGTALAGDTRGWTGADFNGVNAPTSLDGTFVTIGGQAAFIDYISPGQVNALVPSNVSTGLQQITVSNSAGISLPFTAMVNAEEPGLLASPPFNINGTQYAVAQFGDGTYVLPVGAIAGLTSRPAKPGDTIVIYGVGFGPVTPESPAGQLVQQANTLTSKFQLSIGAMAASVAYSGLAANYTGLYQFNIVVPNVGAGNAVPLTFSLDGVAGTQALYIPVTN